MAAEARVPVPTRRRSFQPVTSPSSPSFSPPPPQPWTLALLFAALLLLALSLRGAASGVASSSGKVAGFDSFSLLVLAFALLCGVLALRPSPGAAVRSQPASPAAAASQFFGSAGWVAPYLDPPPPARMRVSSSYPDLRLDAGGDGAAASAEWRFFDDLELHRSRRSEVAPVEVMKDIPVVAQRELINTLPEATVTAARPLSPERDQPSAEAALPQPRRRRHRSLENLPSLQVQEVEESERQPERPADRPVVSTLPPEKKAARRRRAISSDNLSAMWKTPEEEEEETPPRRRPARPGRVRRSAEKLPQLEEEDLTQIAASPRPPQPPPPPPPPPPLTSSPVSAAARLREHKRTKSATDLAAAITLFYQIKKKAGKSKRREDVATVLPELDGGVAHRAHHPPPPPPPPPSLSFRKLFPKKGGGSSSRGQRVHSIPAPPPPPPALQPSSSKLKKPTALVVAIPPPPPSAQPRRHQSRAISRFSPLSPATPDHVASGGDRIEGAAAAAVFCPSPDVDAKADKFIAQFRDGLRLEKLNSLKEMERRWRLELPLSSEGELTPSPSPTTAAMAPDVTAGSDS